jgi:hypothetical protein
MDEAWINDRAAVEAALRTRRPLEAGWMKEVLAAEEPVAAESRA